MVAVLAASCALGPTAAKASPGGTMNPFCDPVTTTSRSQASVATGTQPTLLIASTSISRSCPRTTFAMAPMSLVTPVDVSLWVTSTALMLGSSANMDSTISGSAAVPYSVYGFTTSAP